MKFNYQYNALSTLYRFSYFISDFLSEYGPENGFLHFKKILNRVL